MTPSQRETMEQIAVMQAFVDGEQVEWSWRTELLDSATWRPFPGGPWDWADRRHRVTPAVLEHWGNIYKSWSCLHSTRERADAHAAFCSSDRVAVVRLVEVERFETPE